MGFRRVDPADLFYYTDGYRHVGDTGTTIKNHNIVHIATQYKKRFWGLSKRVECYVFAIPNLKEIIYAMSLTSPVAMKMGLSMGHFARYGTPTSPENVSMRIWWERFMPPTRDYKFARRNGYEFEADKDG